MVTGCIQSIERKRLKCMIFTLFVMLLSVGLAAKLGSFFSWDYNFTIVVAVALVVLTVVAVGFIKQSYFNKGR